MKYKLIAADMDGTLLNNQGVITEETKAAVQRAVDAGIIFAICTGRSIMGAKKYNRILGLKGPTITYNGAMIVSADNNEILFEQGLSREDAKKILELGIKYDTTMIIWSQNQLFGNKLNDRIYDYQKYADVEPQLMESIEQMLDRGITKILWYDHADTVDFYVKEMEKESFGDVTFCTSRPIFLEFFSGRVSKALAMKRLGERYGIAREEMVAVGDELNDLSMIEYAGLGVAMANAKEKVKQAADYITDTNQNDGVARLIDKILEDKI